jgi:hypothetical protein
MSDKVGGGISRGEDDEQVTVTFSGKIETPAQWWAFIDCIAQCAKKFGIRVNKFSKPKRIASVRRKAAKKK